MDTPGEVEGETREGVRERVEGKMRGNDRTGQDRTRGLQESKER